MLTNLNLKPQQYKEELLKTEPIDYESVRQLCLHSNPNLPYCNIENASIVDEKLKNIRRYVPRLVNDINFAIAWKLKEYEPDVVKRFVNNESGIEALDFVEYLKPETILKYLNFIPPITEDSRYLEKAYPLAREYCNHIEVVSIILTSLNPKYPKILDFLLDQLSTYININCLINLSNILYTLNNLMLQGIITKPFQIQQQILKLKNPLISTYSYDLIGCWKILEKQGHQIDYSNLDPKFISMIQQL